MSLKRTKSTGDTSTHYKQQLKNDKKNRTITINQIKLHKHVKKNTTSLNTGPQRRRKLK